MSTASLPRPAFAARQRALTLKLWEPNRVLSERDSARTLVVSLRRSVMRHRVALFVACVAALTATVHNFSTQTETETSTAPVVPDEPGLVAWSDGGITDATPGSKDAPPRAVKGQKAAPCDPDVEFEVNGVCWLEAKKPCAPGKTREYKGRCLVPVSKTVRPPTSTEP